MFVIVVTAALCLMCVSLCKLIQTGLGAACLLYVLSVFDCSLMWLMSVVVFLSAVVFIGVGVHVHLQASRRMNIMSWSVLYGGTQRRKDVVEAGYTTTPQVQPMQLLCLHAVIMCG